MTFDDLNAALAWRNLVADWHLRQEVPLACGCDDDTPDHRLCAPSVAWADVQFAARPEPDLEGPPDRWNHDMWVAAWGRNAPLIADDRDYRLPAPPENTSWLVTRWLVRGRCVVRLALLRLGEDSVSTLASARVDAEPTTVAARGRAMLQRLGF